MTRHRENGFFRRALSKVIPGAVEPPSQVPHPVETDNGPMRVGFIGMVAPVKGVGTLADAAALLGPDAGFRYVIAGDGDPAFMERIREEFPASTAEFLGWTERDAFFRQVDVVVVPSIWEEPFGNVAVEALSYGVPVIAARSGALPEIVEPEKSGLVFTPGDHHELAACLRRLNGDRPLLHRLQQGALARSHEYSPEKMANALDDFVKQVVAQHGQETPNLSMDIEARAPAGLRNPPAHPDR